MPETGVLDIELLPPWKPSSVAGRIQKSVDASRSLAGSVAYWTVAGSEVSAFLPARLSAPSGFMCVDLQLPTNVDQLKTLVDDGAAVYIYCEKLERVPGAKHLIHTKLLLFDLNESEAELWVGSHNWTKPALWGLNVEASIVARVTKDSSLYRDARDLLREIRAVCQPFDPKRVDYYKALQGEMIEDGDLTWSLELYGKNADSLGESAIAIFGQNVRDLKVKALTPIKVTIFDVDKRLAFNYSGEVFHTGPLERYDSAAGGLSLTPRRYAVRRGPGIPELLDEQVIDASVMMGNRYFVTVKVDQLEHDLVAYDPPRASAAWHWVSVDASELASRLDVLQRRAIFHGKAPKLLQPGSPDQVLAQEAGIDSRLAAEERPLFLKKLFRRLPGHQENVWGH